MVEEGRKVALEELMSAFLAILRVWSEFPTTFGPDAPLGDLRNYTLSICVFTLSYHHGCCYPGMFSSSPKAIHPHLLIVFSIICGLLDILCC